MKPSKRRDSLTNLLQSFGIRSELYERGAAHESMVAIAFIELSLESVTLASAIQQFEPKCRCIFLDHGMSPSDLAIIRKAVNDSRFLRLPVTVHISSA
jgi:hypothetical protein